MENTPMPTAGQETVLLVEDSQADAFLVREAFARADITHPIKHCLSGQKALEYLQSAEHMPCLVLLDLNMPGKSGRDVLLEIRGQESTQGLPVLVLSTSDHPDDVDYCYRNGANSYVVKPDDLENLANAFRALRDFWLRTAKLPT